MTALHSVYSGALLGIPNLEYVATSCAVIWDMKAREPETPSEIQEFHLHETKFSLTLHIKRFMNIVSEHSLKQTCNK
jgi:hypothetical protein